jgi:hypothetical protein
LMIPKKISFPGITSGASIFAAQAIDIFGTTSRGMTVIWS